MHRRLKQKRKKLMHRRRKQIRKILMHRRLKQKKKKLMEKCPRVEKCHGVKMKAI